VNPIAGNGPARSHLENQLDARSCLFSLPDSRFARRNGISFESLVNEEIMQCTYSTVLIIRKRCPWTRRRRESTIGTPGGHGLRHRESLDSSRDVAIREAALDLLSEIGYDRLTMDAVAARAHASKATIYRRWQGKAALWSTRSTVRRLDARARHRFAPRRLAARVNDL